jgi:D-alanyl-D-alanine carboxypeptidase
MLIESSNRSAFALSELMGQDQFAGLMNSRAIGMGLTNTSFKDSTGLSANSYSTANDLAILSIYLFNHFPLFESITSLKTFDLYSVDGKLHHKLENTNKLLGHMPGIVGGKTGWTEASKGCFMVIEDNPEEKNHVIHIILGAEDRLVEMENLVDFINIFY